MRIFSKNYVIDNEVIPLYNSFMIQNLLAISELAIKVIAGASGLLLAIVIVVILIVRKNNDKD